MTRSARRAAACLMAAAAVGLSGLTALTGLSPAVANAAPAVDGLVAGSQLPIRPMPPPVGMETIRTVSADYVGTEDQQQDEYDPRVVTVRRTSDGSVATSFDIPDTDGFYEPRLSGDSLVAFVDIGTSMNPQHRLLVHDVATGTLTWSYDVPLDEAVIDAGATWLVTQRGSGASSEVHLVTPAGDTTLAGLTGTSVHVAAADSTTLVLRATGHLWLVDLATAAVTQVTAEAAPDAADWYAPVVLGPTRLFWVNAVYPGGVATDRIFSVSRSDPTGGSTSVDATSTGRVYYAFGDGIAATRGTGDRVYELDPLDLTTGDWEPAVLSDVTEARPLGDGGVAATLADTATGRVVTLHDDGAGARTVFQLPPRPYQAMTVALSGTTAAADYGDPYSADFTSPTTWFHAADGSGDWNQSPALGRASAAGPLEAFAGGVVLTRVGPADRLSWAGGSRDVPAKYVGAVLGRGGQYVAVPVESTAPVAWQVEPVTAATVVETLPAQASFAIDGSWLWTGPSAQGVLTGVDLSGVSAPRSVPTGLASCAYPALQVMARWAIVQCAGTLDQRVVDLRGVVPTWQLPVQKGDLGPQLGNGFAAWAHYATAVDGSLVETLVVADLAPGHATRSYGPLHGAYGAPSPSFAVDDGGSPSLVYLDARRQVSHVTLDWLQTAPWTRPDRTPPVVTSAAGSRPVPSTTTLSFRWTAADPTSDVEPASGVSSYDARYRVATPGAGSFSGWQYPTAWQRMTTTSVTRPTRAGAEVCFEVRARDKAGNVSTFGHRRCSAVPYDDRGLSATTGVTRLQLSTALDGTLSRLDRLDATLSRTSLAGHTVVLVIRRGPKQGTASVYVGSHLIGNVGFTASTWQYARVWLATNGYTGTVRVRSTSARPAPVDGLAVIR